jgi:hypothetical protein
MRFVKIKYTNHLRDPKTMAFCLDCELNKDVLDSKNGYAILYAQRCYRFFLR